MGIMCSFYVNERLRADNDGDNDNDGHSDNYDDNGVVVDNYNHSDDSS